MSDRIRNLVYVSVHNKTHELGQIFTRTLFQEECKYVENLSPLRQSLARYNYVIVTQVYAHMDDLKYNVGDFIGTFPTS